jgi:hypothetical protein
MALREIYSRGLKAIFFILFRSILIIFFKVNSSKAVCPIDVWSAKSLLSPSMSREYLENIYFTFIRPILEYSSEVWDNCGQVNSDRLEKLQLEAARIVTGLTCYTSLDFKS